MAKYRKMQKMGMPPNVIRNKMKLDGVTDSEQDAFFDPKPSSSGDAAPPNPKLAKYQKMKKMGMPMNAIINKMRLDAVGPDDIAQFQNR